MAALIDARSDSWTWVEPLEVDASRDGRKAVRMKASPLRPANGGVVGGHNNLLGPPDEGIEPSWLIDRGRHMKMGHHRCADHPTDGESDGYVPGVVHIDDRRPMPNTGTDGSECPHGGRHRCSPRGKRTRNLSRLPDECVPARPVVTDALVEEVDVPATVGQDSEDGKLRCLSAAHGSKMICEREYTSICHGFTW